MTIKQQGGIFGRNPTFNDLTAGSGSSIEGSGDNVTFSVDRTDASTAGALVLRAANGNLSIDSDGADKDILIRTGGSTERARFYGDSGDFSIKGNLVVDSGQGIDFSATSGTGTSELFDDYEEGTWTPTLSNFGGTPIVSGSYTKIGNLVYLEFSVQLDGTSDTSSYQVLGLPYTPTDVGGGYIARTNGGYADGLVSITTASSRIDVKDSSNSGVNYNTFGNSSTTKFVVFYRVA